MKLTLFMLILLLPHLCLAQVPPSIQQQLEARAEAEGEEIQIDGHLLQQLEYFKKHRININATSAEELQQLRILTDIQILSLLQYEKLTGKLIDVYELQAVPAFDLASIHKLLPFIEIGEAVSLKQNLEARLQGEHTILLRLSRVVQKAKGYRETSGEHYLGDPDHLLFQYRFQYKDLLYFGLTADKDAGEQFFKGAQRNGFDFYSMHVFLRRLGWIKALALGDFTVSLGQGLIQWQAYAMGKSSSTMDIKRTSPVLLPYRSSGENNFNRGLGITIGRNFFEATGFVSAKKISGHLSDDSIESFTTMNSSGLFRTPSEIKWKNNISLFSFGGSARYEKKSLRLSMNFVGHQFGMTLDKSDQPYNYYSFYGKRFINGSVDYSYSFKNFHLFGETASDKHCAFASINGVIISIDRDLDLSFLSRHIPPAFSALAGQAFTENSTPSNENGFYAGLSFRPGPTTDVIANDDFIRFPWLKFRMNAPVHGRDYLVQFAYHPTKQIEVYVRYHFKEKPLNAVTILPIATPESNNTKDLRIQFTDQLNRSISVKGRVEVLWFNSGTTQAQQGFLLFSETSFKIFVKINCDLRLQYFESDGYESRLFAYEADVLYSSTVASFFDEGLRYYINTTYKCNKNFSIFLRWSGTMNQNKNHTGSGLDEIDGTKKEEIKVQLLFHF
ncbi:MAG: ComEA family DNA-binding protein [Flavisolibacter sp.]